MQVVLPCLTGWLSLVKNWAREGIALAALVLGIGLATPAWAGTLDASYLWVSTTDLGDGTHRVTLELTVTNETTESYTDLTIELYDDETVPFVSFPETVEVGAVPAGSTVTLSHAVDVYSPVDRMTSMVLIGNAMEGDGSIAPTTLAISQANGGAQ